MYILISLSLYIYIYTHILTPSSGQGSIHVNIQMFEKYCFGQT